jgi:hypothetical protein
VPQVVVRQAHPAAMVALELVAVPVLSLVRLQQKSLEPLVARAQRVQPPVLKPEQLLQVSPQVQTQEQQVPM